MISQLQAMAREAKAAGNPPPVGLALAGPVGDLILADLGRPPARVVETRDEHGRQDYKIPGSLAGLERAASLLEKHGREGGKFVARLLREGGLGAFYWTACVWTDHIRIAANDADGTVIGCYQVGYDEVSRRMRTPLEIANDDGPCMVHLRGDDGLAVIVFGRTGIDAQLSSALVGMVCTGKLSGPHPRTGLLAEVPLTDDILAGYLLRVHDDSPNIVAEAITALKKLPGGKERRLLRLLRNRPELESLSKAVRAELDGVAGGV